MISLVVAAWLALQVQGAGSCPSPGEVEEKLAPLLPVGFASSSDRPGGRHGGGGRDAVGLARAPRRQARRPPAAAARGDLRRAGPDGGCRARGLGSSDSPRDFVAARSPGGVAGAVERGVPAGGGRRPRDPASGGKRRRRAPLDLGVGAAAMGAWQPGSVAPGARLDAVLGTARAGVARPALGRGPGNAHREPVSRGGPLVAPLLRARGRLCDSPRPALGSGAGRGRRVGGRHGGRRGLHRRSHDPDRRSGRRGSRCGSICASVRSDPGWGWRS